MKTKKMHYLTPQTEIVLVEIAPFAVDVTSWNPDKGKTDDLLIIEGDPVITDPDNAGKGANGNNVWDEEDFASNL